MISPLISVLVASLIALPLGQVLPAVPVSSPYDAPKTVVAWEPTYLHCASADPFSAKMGPFHTQGMFAIGEVDAITARCSVVLDSGQGLAEGAYDLIDASGNHTRLTDDRELCLKAAAYNGYISQFEPEVIKPGVPAHQKAQHGPDEHVIVPGVPPEIKWHAKFEDRPWFTVFFCQPHTIKAMAPALADILNSDGLPAKGTGMPQYPEAHPAQNISY
jgi:hypothetical protein